MASSPGSVDYWRKFFRSADSDIFGVMEHAIVVAASDYPEQFRSRRDGLVEKFFTALLPRCLGCDRVDPRGAEGEEGRGSVRRVGEKENKVDSSNDGPESSARVVSNYTYDEAEALTEEIEEEGQIVEEVLRIKEILANHREESDNVLFELLRRLQLMELSVDVLKVTEIGRAVNGLRKHNSKQIRHLVRALIDGWKVLVDEWVSATGAIADNSPDSVNPSIVDDEEGLPSPPLDEGALFTAQTTSIRLSEVKDQINSRHFPLFVASGPDTDLVWFHVSIGRRFAKFFDGMDDDGNFGNNWEFDKKRQNRWRPTGNCETVRIQQPIQQLDIVEEENVEMRRQETERSILPEENIRRQESQQAISEEKLQNNRQERETRQSKPHNISIGQAKSQSIMSKQSKPVIAESGPGRPVKYTSEQNGCSKVKPGPRQDTATLQRKPPMIPQNEPIFSEDASVRAKLEFAKRKLHEGYRQAENAKKQRTIQVMELHDIPKQAHNSRQPILKSKNNSRNWANGWH
ncbi:hypothetical protein MUK42_19615 [Musa troglodytarum]|uniref:TFIIS N-terminal domain-containing protein n=1 Tax=Musa troglodytarum TaxID=320322 RepID=A0A9E7FWM1_9LILI|nr:hypothetical protein MUK42_19615 [Musa troglodytarum]